MNHKIREVAEQAAKFSAVMALPTGELGDKLFVEKFAQLIVRECGQVLVDKTPVVNFVEGEDWDKGYDRAMNDCIHHIYEHFGIEE